MAYRPRVIPVLLLRERGLVKTIGFADATYLGDPINAVKIFNDAEADELVFLDIDAGAQGRLPPAALVRQIAEEAFMPFTIGGGIRTLDDVRAMIDMGAEKVAINAAAVSSPAVIGQAAEIFGAQAVVVSIDARRDADGVYRTYTAGGQRATGQTVEDAARAAERAGAGEILVSSIDRDGTMAGYDLELVRRATGAVGVPVIACGGAGAYEELRAPVAEAGASAVAAGSLFLFVGRKRGFLINYPDQDELGQLFAGLPHVPGETAPRGGAP
jgi:cyclase